LFIYTFDDLVKKRSPKLWKHMEELQMKSCNKFVEFWFTRLFVGDLPFQTVLRLLDAYLTEGTKILYRVALALLETNERTLLACTSEEALVNTLKQKCAQITDQDRLIKYACGIRLSKQLFMKYETQNRPKLSDVTEPSCGVYYRPKITGSSKLVPEGMFELLYEWIPQRFRIQDLVKKFSSDECGYSLLSFYKVVENTAPTFVFLKSMENNIFGTFVTVEWTKTGQMNYIGTPETFIFTLKPKIEKFAAKQKNEFFLSVGNNEFSLGGGSSFALYVRDGWEASSSACDTFINPPLNGEYSEKFEIVHIEVFGFE